MYYDRLARKVDTMLTRNTKTATFRSTPRSPDYPCSLCKPSTCPLQAHLVALQGASRYELRHLKATLTSLRGNTRPKSATRVVLNAIFHGIGSGPSQHCMGRRITLLDSFENILNGIRKENI
ncbi:hypothetical protein BD310DRAFT_314581 [Dichomitus squalens]|uniref:Uncharacterized protein n=1 Tax=Dichomitus squalens TaxID=114155 RepID=A0A4Q9PGS9_9APHY|nr:hypothetical protein BD310DRAFT_314581 [Dichomitus squalens]